MEESNINFRYVGLCDLDSYRKIAKLFANSGDPDQTHILWCLYYLPITLWVFRQKWVYGALSNVSLLQTRLVHGAIKKLENILSWVGLSPDEGKTVLVTVCYSDYPKYSGKGLANSGDPDQMPQNVPSDQALHTLFAFHLAILTHQEL